MSDRSRPVAGLLLFAGLMALGFAAPMSPAAVAGDAPPAGEPAGPDEATPLPEPPAAEAPAPLPQVQSPFQTRVYRVKAKKLWKDLLVQMEAAGFPPEEVDAERMTVRTTFVDFSQESYSEQVAEPPPYLSPKYPILQMAKIREGKVSLEGILARAGRATELKLRARILVQGVDRRKGIRVLTDRRSSGVIESEFLRKLETILGLERVADPD